MKSWLIIFSVGSNTASKIAGTCEDSKDYVGARISFHRGVGAKANNPPQV